MTEPNDDRGPRDGRESDSPPSDEGANRERTDAGGTRSHDEQVRTGSRSRGRSRGQRARSERKERVLHTRISEPLAEDIRRIAEELRVPVSNIVRNVLEEAFSVVETVTENVGDLIEDVIDDAERGEGWARHFRNRWDAPGRRRRTHGDTHPGERTRSRPSPQETDRATFDEILGWQPLILNRVQTCADCGDELRKNDRTFVGMHESGSLTTYLCQDCMDRQG